MLWYFTISCMIKIKTKFLLRLIGDVITNGNKHLGTFLEPHNSLSHFQCQNFEFDGNFFIQSIQ
jgi:hypothetical protein